MDVVEYMCKPCVGCNKQKVLNLPASGYQLWKFQGEYVQNAFPELSADDRELLISGTCAECFAEMFPPDEDDDGRFTCDDLGCCDVGVGILHHLDCGRLYSDREYDPPTVEEEEMFPPDIGRV